MTGLGYTLPAVLAVAAVCALELSLLRTGLFRRPAYWLSMVIVLGFQVPVDGWLTKLSSPIVIYDEHQITGLRFPFDIPIEDFLFGFAMVTAVLLLWERQRVHVGEGSPLPTRGGIETTHQLVADHPGGRSHAIDNGPHLHRRATTGHRSRNPGDGRHRHLRHSRRD